MRRELMDMTDGEKLRRFDQLVKMLQTYDKEEVLEEAKKYGEDGRPSYVYAYGMLHGKMMLLVIDAGLDTVEGDFGG